MHSANESRKTVGIVSATMQVLEKALKTIPGCEQLVGRANLRTRFARLECALSRHYFSNRQWTQFSLNWLRAALNDRRTAFDLGLPAPAMNRLRWYARRLGLG
jgi:hypothetical protein